MKRLMKATLWIVCYGGASWFGIKSKLGFDILSENHWKLLFDKSVHARWPGEMAPKKLVCKVLLIFIIVGILGLTIVIKKKKTRIPVVKGELPDKENFRPAPMLSQGKIAAPPPTPMPMSTTTPTNAGTFSQPQPHTPPVNLMGDTIRKITEVTNAFNVTVFPHVKLENTFTQLVVSDDATALLLKILPQSGVWKVEPAELIEESLWSVEAGQPTPLLKDIIASTATLARLEPDAHAVAVVLISCGQIENAAETKKYLEQNGIRIACLDNQVMPDIPTWQQLLSEFYVPKEEEGNESINTSQNM